MKNLYSPTGRMFRLVLICPIQRMFHAVPLDLQSRPNEYKDFLLFNSTLLVETLCGQASGNDNILIINNLLIFCRLDKSRTFSQEDAKPYTQKNTMIRLEVTALQPKAPTEPVVSTIDTFLYFVSLSQIFLLCSPAP